MSEFSKKKLVICQSVGPRIDFVVIDTIGDGIGYFHAFLLSGRFCPEEGLHL
jgi:hypothetical protein